MTTRSMRGQYAGFASRTVALVVDLLILTVVLLGINWFFASVLGMFNIQVSDCVMQVLGTERPVHVCTFLSSASVILTLTMMPAYFIFFWVIADGMTPGHALMGLRVVRMSAKPMRLHVAVVRWIGYLVCFLSFGLGFIWVLLDNQRQGWHDTMASTCVLYTREVQPNESTLEKWRTRFRHRKDTEVVSPAAPITPEEIPDPQSIDTMTV